MPDNAEVLDLRRRARRRLIGAIALVLALVIVPPWIMDLEPRPVATDLTVQIPAQDAKRSPPPVAASPPSEASAMTDPPLTAKPDAGAKSEPSPPPAQAPKQPKAAKSEVAKAESNKPEGSTRPEAALPSKKDADAPRAEAILNAETFVVPLGSFASRENVKSLEGKLAKAGIKYYTETITAAGVGQTRVRAGPYPTKDAAERAREQLKALGLAPGNVVARQ